jgi:tetratricopeptide (TPR) repeat protein
VIFAALFFAMRQPMVNAQPGKPTSGAGSDLPKEPDDRLSPKMERRLQECIEQGRPQEAATLLKDQPLMYRVYVARAYAQAGLAAEPPKQREHCFGRAVKEYRTVIALQQDPQWFRGERRRFEIAQWRIELGDIILRHWSAPDLDRYEITSGLDFDRPRLTNRLREAHETYAGAGPILEDLMIGLRTQEEKYLLLGIATKIAVLREQQELNGAWATLYLAMVQEEGEAEDRNALLADALSTFDAVGRTAKDSARKHSALLGAGIALSQARRNGEAEAAFDRLIQSTAPLAVSARARFEKARSLIQARRFTQARNELDVLAAIPKTDLSGDNAGAAFYVQLAPLIRAATYLLEAKKDVGGDPEPRKKLDDTGRSQLAELSAQGGMWPEIVQIYLEAYAGEKRSLTDLTDLELRIKAGRLMGGKDYAGAVEALTVLLSRASTKEHHVETQFNLGVCYFQLQDLRRAAEAFSATAKMAPPGEVREKAAEHAYRSWCQLANESKAPEDYRRLGEACDLLAEQLPRQRLASEAVWIAALARQEAGDYAAAALAYAKVPPASERYWPARRNMARCKQAVYDALSTTTSPARRRRTAEEAAEAWRRLAEDLVAAKVADGDYHPGMVETQASAVEARLAAAALLAGSDLRAFEECLRLLDDQPLTGRVAALRIRCYRGLGNLKAANSVLEKFLQQEGRNGVETAEEATSTTQPSAILGALIGLAAEMEDEVARLRASGRDVEATRTAAEAAETIRQLLEWLQGQPRYHQHIPAIRFGLVKAVAQAGRPEEALAQLEQLIAEKPDEGEYLRTAARLQEDVARGLAGADGAVSDQPNDRQQAALDRAEAFWARLLKAPTLRSRAPEVYWEARYHWLEHQLRHGRAAEVARGIESEKAWYPDLGGPPWQARLLELAGRAEQASRKGQAQP